MPDPSPRPDLTSYLGQTLTVKVDRPLGSTHPQSTFTYPLNYGYLPGTQGGDGEPIDAYILGVEASLSTFTGVCIALILRQDDAEDKLVLAPPGCAFTQAQIAQAVHFQERYFTSHVIIA